MKGLFVLVLLLVGINLSATNYYIKKCGNDSANGLTDNTAWASATKASATTFKAGDSILFKRGDKWASTSIVIGSQGGEKNNIVLGSYGTGDKPILTSSIGIVIKITTANRGYWTIEGLDIRSTHVGIYKTPLGICADYWLNNDLGVVPGWIIQNCNFNCGILFSGPNVIIRDNVFDGTSQQNVNFTAITIRGGNGLCATVDRNTIKGYRGRGIWVYNGVPNATVSNNNVSNVIEDNDGWAYGINNDGHGIPNPNFIAYGNTVSNIERCGINGENDFNAQYYNNYITTCGWYGIASWASGICIGVNTNNVIRNNIISNCDSGIILYNSPGATIENNILYKSTLDSINNMALVLYGDVYTNIHDVIFNSNIIVGSKWKHIIYTFGANDKYYTMFKELDYNVISTVGTELWRDTYLGSITLDQLKMYSLMKHGTIIKNED